MLLPRAPLLGMHRRCCCRCVLAPPAEPTALLTRGPLPRPTSRPSLRQILKNIRGSVEPRNSVCHSATVFANAMMHCGTTVDAFLRDNLDWLKKATNWAKFSATAGGST